MLAEEHLSKRALIYVMGDNVVAECKASYFLFACLLWFFLLIFVAIKTLEIGAFFKEIGALFSLLVKKLINIDLIFTYRFDF